MKARTKFFTDEQITKTYAKVTAKTMLGEIPKERTDKVMKWVSLFTTTEDDLMRMTVLSALLRNREFPEAVDDTINNIVIYENDEEEIADWERHGGDVNLIKAILKGKKK